MSKHAPPLIHGDDGGIVDKDVEFHIISLNFAGISDGSQNLRDLHMEAC
jgi:hypothetical protein